MSSSASDNDAHVESASLTQHFKQKLIENKDLEQRVNLIEEQLQRGTPRLRRSLSGHSQNNSGSHLTVCMSRNGVLDIHPLHRDFEGILHASWVYHRTHNRRDSISIRSSIMRQSTWSALSELSMAQISIVSVISLPTVQSKLFNAQWRAHDEVRNEITTAQSEDYERASDIA